MNVSKMQAYLGMQTYIIYRVMHKFSSVQNGIGSGRITCWTQEIQFFLRSYTTPYVMRDVVDALHNVRT